jgi:hypothetical protein
MQDVNESLKRHEHKLLDAFTAVFPSKRPPKSLRALQPLAFVFLLEAFGLLYLLNREIVRAAILAARGPGKGDDDTPQLSILDATAKDEVLGVFVSDVSLRAESPPVVKYLGQTLDLSECKTPDVALWRAVSNGWIAYLDRRGAVVGLRLIPCTEGIQTRLRAPLVNIVSMFQEDKRDEYIEQLRMQVEYLGTQLQSTAESTKAFLMREQQWQDATGASDPEMARELTAQRIEKIKSLTAERDMAVDATKDEIRKLRAGIEEKIERSDETQIHEKAEGVGRMIWPDPDNAPTPIACANTIVAHRRGEFVELEFPSTPKIFDNVRAWLGFHQFGVRAPTPDATGYCTCAIGPCGEIPPAWNTMKQGKRDSYPGFVLFGPGNTGKVVFCANEPSIKRTAKRSSKKVML